MNISPKSGIETLYSSFERLQITNNKATPRYTQKFVLFPESMAQLSLPDFWKLVQKTLSEDPSTTHVSIAGVGAYTRDTLQFFLHHSIHIEAAKIHQCVQKFAKVGLTGTQDGGNLTRFHIAAIIGSETVLPSTATKDELRVLDPKGRSSLLLCVLLKHFDVARRLFALGEDPETPTPLYGSALSLALQRQQTEFSSLFLSTKKVALLELRSFSEYQQTVCSGSNREIRITEVAPALFSIVHQRKEKNSEIFDKVVRQDPSSRNLLLAYYEYETRIRALCHSCNMPMSIPAARSGILPHIIHGKSQTTPLRFTSISGGYPDFFCHEMAKATASLQKLYPDTEFPYEQMVLQRLHTILDFTSNQPQKRASDILARCRANEPTMITTGIGNIDHIVTVFMWENLFILCNRGAYMRKSVEIYSYCNRYLTEDLIERMQAGSISPEAYSDFFFITLREKLCFHQRPIDRELETAFSLPEQVTGNCSWKSAETAVYCYFILSQLAEKKLLAIDDYFDEKLKPPIATADSFFNNWLYFQQLSYIQQYLDTTSVKEPAFLTTLCLLPQIQDRLDHIMRCKILHPEIREKALAVKMRF